LADTLTSLWYDNVDHCGEFDLGQSIEDHCSGVRLDADGAETHPCDFGQIFVNLFEVHVLDLLAAGSVITDSIMNFTLQCDGDTFYEQTLALGKQFGAMTAYAIDF